MILQPFLKKKFLQKHCCEPCGILKILFNTFFILQGSLIIQGTGREFLTTLKQEIFLTISCYVYILLIYTHVFISTVCLGNIFYFQDETETFPKYQSKIYAGTCNTYQYCIYICKKCSLISSYIYIYHVTFLLHIFRWFINFFSIIFMKKMIHE